MLLHQCICFLGCRLFAFILKVHSTISLKILVICKVLLRERVSVRATKTCVYETVERKSDVGKTVLLYSGELKSVSCLFKVAWCVCCEVNSVYISL